MDGNPDVIRYGNDKRACCVPHCKSHGNFYKDGKKIGYFTFPTKEPEKSLWVEKCNVTTIDNFKPRTAFVCTDHFYEDEIEYFPFSKKWRRKPGVMPTRFHCWTDIAKSEPEDSESPTLVAPSPSTIEKLKLPDALGVRPNFTETLGMLSNFDSDVPSNILKDDLDDLSNAPLDLEAIIEEPLTMKDETDGVKIADDAPTPMPTVSSEAKKIKTTSTKVITASSGQKNKKDSSQTAPAVNPTIRNIRTETVPHSVLIKHAPVESDSDSYDGFSDSEDSDEDLPWSNSLSIPTQSDPLNSSSAIDINTILASANNASSILSAAMNTTSTTLSQDDLAEKIQKRIQKATCINCSAMFLDPRDLKKHILTHKKTLYACELCSEKFPTVFLLKKHSRIHQSSGGSVGLSSQTSNHGNDRKSKRKREDDDPDWE